MKLIIEKSIRNIINPVLRAVKYNWGIDACDIKYVENITTEPYQQIDYVHAGRQWKLIFPVNGGTAFFIDYNLHKDQILSYAGGATGDGDKKLDSGDKVAIIVYGDETQEILELRVIHELLHAQDLNSDLLDKYVVQFLGFYDLIIYFILRFCKKSPEHLPYYQRLYYKWLLKQRQKGLM